MDIAVTYAGRAGSVVELADLLTLAYNRAGLAVELAGLPSLACHTYCSIPIYTCLYMIIGLYPLCPRRVGVIAMHGNARVRLRYQHTLTTSVIIVVVIVNAL